MAPGNLLASQQNCQQQHSVANQAQDLSQTRLRTTVQFSECFNLGHAAWDRAMTSKGPVHQSAHPCSKTQVGIAQQSAHPCSKTQPLTARAQHYVSACSIDFEKCHCLYVHMISQARCLIQAVHNKGEAKREWSNAGMREGGGNGRSPRKTLRTTASSCSIPTCRYTGMAPPGVEPGSPSDFSRRNYEYRVDVSTITAVLSIAFGCCLLEDDAFSYLNWPLRIRVHPHGSYVIRVQTVDTCHELDSSIRRPVCSSVRSSVIRRFVRSSVSHASVCPSVNQSSVCLSVLRIRVYGISSEGCGRTRRSVMFDMFDGLTDRKKSFPANVEDHEREWCWGWRGKVTAYSHKARTRRSTQRRGKCVPHGVPFPARREGRKARVARAHALGPVTAAPCVGREKVMRRHVGTTDSIWPPLLASLKAYTKDEVGRSRWLRTTNIRVPTLNWFFANTASENGVVWILAYTRQKSKSKYRNRIRLERASQKQSSDTHETPYDRVKRCRERKIDIKASERVNCRSYGIPSGSVKCGNDTSSQWRYDINRGVYIALKSTVGSDFFREKSRAYESRSSSARATQVLLGQSNKEIVPHMHCKLREWVLLVVQTFPFHQWKEDSTSAIQLTAWRPAHVYWRELPISTDEGTYMLFAVK
ncbi:hypothetical protein PR048_007508 [Dryococelus australis]|uniref:Uncharacterized protein n=1 Tax=Dryococelus australis TaxID=614101 RepID=A0ABQ9HW38_9NEOP|nr:hypothetical protein PR048_007508 [Dryococelus australis]